MKRYLLFIMLFDGAFTSHTSGVLPAFGSSELVQLFSHSLATEWRNMSKKYINIANPKPGEVTCYNVDVRP
jgi:hypothetical protein